MSFDAYTTVACANELNSWFSGAKIEKVTSPTPTSIFLFCHNHGQTRKLHISALPSAPKISISNINYENPKTPSTFCQQLRRHLLGAVINYVKTPKLERVVEIEFKAFDELGESTKKSLFIELIGKSSNVIFTEEKNSENIVLGIMRYFDITESRRPLLIGSKYELPPSQDKLDLNNSSYEEMVSLILKCESKNCEKFIIDNYLGLSPIHAREIAYRAGLLGVEIKLENSKMLWNEMQSFSSAFANNLINPTVVYRKDGEPFDIAIIDINQYENEVDKKHFDSISEMMESFTISKDSLSYFKQRTQDLSVLINNTRSKLAKKITLQQKELLECDKMDEYKLYGDLLTASIYMLKNKAKFAEVVNYYSDDLNTIKIPMDEKITPSQNAAKYYKKYNKLKNAKGILTEQIDKSYSEIEYLDSVESAMLLCKSAADILEIREELKLEGYIKSVDNKKQKQNKKNQISIQNFIHFVSKNGFDIYVGKNNIQNDYLTTKFALKNDYWFHVKDYPGSHVILRISENEEPPMEDIIEAGEIAAKYSSVSNSSNIAVDYTKVRNVKKPAGSKPGKVIYNTNNTLYITPKK